MKTKPGHGKKTVIFIQHERIEMFLISPFKHLNMIAHNRKAISLETVISRCVRGTVEG